METLIKNCFKGLPMLTRFLFPVFFIFWRTYEWNEQQILYIIYSLMPYTLAFLIYPIYKALYWIPIRKVQCMLKLVPQLTWHKKLIDTICPDLSEKEKKVYSSFSIWSSCIHDCLIEINDEKQNKLLRINEWQNTIVHILYMTSFVSACMLLISLMINRRFLINDKWYFDVIIIVACLITGTIYDNLIADVRELSLLKRNKEGYIKILKSSIRN